MTLAPAGRPGRALEPSPAREALRLCAVHLRFAVLFSALVNVAYLAPTLYMLGVYDMVVPSGSGLTLIFVTAALLFTLATLTTLDKLRSGLLSAASLRIDNVFAPRLFRRVFQTAGRGAGSPRLNQVMREFDTIRAAATGPAALALFDAPWTPIYILVCFYLHWAIGSVALGGAVVLLILTAWNERSTRGRADRALEASSQSFALQEAAGGSADVVRALGMGGAFTARLQEARRTANIPTQEAARANGRIGGLIRFLRLLLQSAALGLGAWLAINKQISAGAIFASSMLSSRALGPMDSIVAQWRTVSQAVSAYRALKAQAAAVPAPARTELPRPAPRLKVSGLSIATPGRDRFILSDISFGADGAQVIGVIGQSGAGKTTLVQALANARGIDRGEIRLDGARFQDWDDDRLGRLIGYMPQDCVLFPGTVKDNISRFEADTGADPALVDAQAIAAAKQAGVHELILGLDGGYDFRVGPRGRGLSAGQQQRVALARALYGDPVLCVFDEPNANLDAEGEAILLRVIAELKARGALVVVSAHRLGLIVATDALALLRNGRLDRYGPRQEVLDWLKAESARSAPARPQADPVAGMIGGPRA